MARDLCTHFVVVKSKDDYHPTRRKVVTMTYVRVSPTTGRSLFEDSFDSIVYRIANDVRNTTFSDFPRVDVYEDDTHLYADVELPGYTKDEVKITIHNDVLTIKGERKGKRDNGYRYVHTERVYGSFSRSFALPVEVESARVQAEYTNGVLRIVMPKSKPRDIERTIEIK